MPSAAEYTAEIQADDKITWHEVNYANKYQLASIASTLDQWEKVRTHSGVVGANQDYIDISGVGRFEWDPRDGDESRSQQDALVETLRDKFAFPILKSDSQRAESSQLRPNEVEAVQVGGSPDQVVSESPELVSQAEQVQTQMNTEASGAGVSTTVVALAVGAVAVAVAVFGGN